jgi:RecA-family ATPase
MLNKKASDVDLEQSITGNQNITARKNNTKSIQSQTLTNFLKALMPNAESINLRFFTPDRDSKKARAFSDIPISRLISLETLDRLNSTNEKYGIYFCVNSGGQKDIEITKLNACFVESDTKSIAEQNLALDKFPIETSARIETRKSVHAYFFLIDEYRKENYKTEEEWEEIISKWKDAQARLIAYFEGDEKLKNPSRVMRLPGFDHLTPDGSRKRIKLTQLDPERRYRLDELIEAFPPVKQCLKPERSETHTSGSKSQPKIDISRFETSDLEEAKRKAGQVIMERSRKNPSGSFPFKCPLHNGNGSTSAYYYPDSNRMGCGKCKGDFNIKVALEHFGIYLIPEKKSIDIQIEIEEESEDNSGFIIPSADLIQPRAYLVDKLIPDDRVTIFAGEGGIGKSYASVAIASVVSNGKGFPLSENTKPGKVMIYSDEDTYSDITERLIWCDANLRNIRIKTGALPFVGKDLAKLKLAIEAEKPSLVIIDPASAYCPNLNLERRDHAQHFISPLRKLAEENKVAILLIFHFTKGIGAESLRSRIAGSSGIPDYARSALVVERSQDTPGNCVITQVKRNYSGQSSSLEYRIDDKTGIFEWIGYSEVKPEDLLASRNKRLEQFIMELLGKYEYIQSTKLVKECKEVFTGIKDHQIDYAKQKVGITRDSGCVFWKHEISAWCVRSPERAKEASKKEMERVQVKLYDIKQSKKFA